MPAGVGIAMAIGLGFAAFEEDLSARTDSAGVSTPQASRRCSPSSGPSLCSKRLHRVAGTCPVTDTARRPRGWPPGRRGISRVLWVGDPAVLPVGAWQLFPGLAYTRSENGFPDATSLWPGSSPGPASAVGTAVRLTESDKTVHLGYLLAPYAIRYVIVVSTLGPTAVGSQPAQPGPSGRAPQRPGGPDRPPTGDQSAGVRRVRRRRRLARACTAPRGSGRSPRICRAGLVVVGLACRARRRPRVHPCDRARWCRDDSRRGCPPRCVADGRARWSEPALEGRLRLRSELQVEQPRHRHRPFRRIVASRPGRRRGDPALGLGVGSPRRAQEASR